MQDFLDAGYPPAVAEALAGIDESIASASYLSPNELMDKFLEWNGICGYTSLILDTLEQLNERTPPDPSTDGNLRTCPFRVMYNETARLHAGDKLDTRDREHVGVSSLAEALRTVLAFRDYASRGTHFLPRFEGYPVLNSAWIEYEHRRKLEF